MKAEKQALKEIEKAERKAAKLNQKAKKTDQSPEDDVTRQEIRKRVEMLLPIYSSTMTRPEIRKEVVVEYKNGLTIQDTIKRLSLGVKNE